MYVQRRRRAPALVEPCDIDTLTVCTQILWFAGLLLMPKGPAAAP